MTTTAMNFGVPAGPAVGGFSPADEINHRGSGLGRLPIESLATQLGGQHAWRDACPGRSFVLWVARR
ncbi:MAG: hypothetical protein EPO51_06180 [Phenylobacterium sp.]|uniref:hypothetical protein n=1 Tax=Phenylobacterium sp. TaxID=1871053 RepID=UPI00122AAC3A|nr:hypothetical protein [Phenylobacterium sp.]TAJ73220.1 MAG: hypothetical protein EPO51_06180 [Phenylobacterium sp.]